jgi:hypothetical protein
MTAYGKLAHARQGKHNLSATLCGGAACGILALGILALLYVNISLCEYALGVVPGLPLLCGSLPPRPMLIPIDPHLAVLVLLDLLVEVARCSLQATTGQATQSTHDDRHNPFKPKE